MFNEKGPDYLHVSRCDTTMAGTSIDVSAVSGGDDLTAVVTLLDS
jgi:hypothetical protein